MGLLKGQVLSPKFTTAEITDSDNRIHYVPIKHTIGDYFLAEIDGKYFAFSTKDARYLTHRSKSGIGKSFQVIQYDTSHFTCLSPTTKELEHMIETNGIGKIDRRMHNILSILARREKNTFGKWEVNGKFFEKEKQAKKYLDSLEVKTVEVKGDDNIPKQIPITIKQNVHSVAELKKIFENEKGEFPDQVREINNYLKELDITEIVTPVRKITDFITGDLIATIPSFLSDGIARYQRLDGTLREITNVPVKPKGNMMKYMMIIFPIVLGVLIIFTGHNEGWFDGIIDFTDNLGTIQEGFKGLPAPGAIVRTSNTGGADYSDASLMSKYPDCDSMTVAINTGTLDYNKMSASMKGLVDTC